MQSHGSTLPRGLTHRSKGVKISLHFFLQSGAMLGKKSSVPKWTALPVRHPQISSSSSVKHSLAPMYKNLVGVLVPLKNQTKLLHRKHCQTMPTSHQGFWWSETLLLTPRLHLLQGEPLAKCRVPTILPESPQLRRLGQLSKTFQDSSVRA